MAYTRKTTKPAAETTEVQAEDVEQAFHSVGALFATKSDKVPYVGPVDEDVVEALGLTTPPDKEWKLFTSVKKSKAGREYLSIYLGLSDIRR